MAEASPLYTGFLRRRFGQHCQADPWCRVLSDVRLLPPSPLAGVQLGVRCARGRERRRFHPEPSRTGSCPTLAPESTARGTAWEARPLRAHPTSSQWRGVEQRQLAGLITRRSWVRIPPPLPPPWGTPSRRLRVLSSLGLSSPQMRTNVPLSRTRLHLYTRNCQIASEAAGMPHVTR